MGPNKIIIIALAAGIFHFNAYAAGSVPERPALEQLTLEGSAAYAPETLPVTTEPVRSAKAGRDLTGDYQRIYKQADKMMRAKGTAELRKYKVLLVPGLMSNNATAPSSFLGIEIRQASYFQAQIKTLKELGVDYTLVPIESEQTPEYNAGIVGYEIAGSEKPVIIICHSKGGLDTLTALVEHSGLRSKVRGIVAVQTPFLGSPAADYILRHGALTRMTGWILEANTGTIACMHSLATDIRRQYYALNKPAIDEITATVPIISLGSWKENIVYNAAVRPFKDGIIAAMGGLRNDGYVPLESAILPGTDYILAEGVGHLETVLGDSLPSFTKTLLLMIISI